MSRSLVPRLIYVKHYRKMWSGQRECNWNVIDYITVIIECRQAIRALLSQRTVEISTEDENSYYSSGLSRDNILSLVCPA